MEGKIKKALEEILESFDSTDLDNKYRRRVAVKPLYDYFQRLILEIAANFCYVNRDSIKNAHLKTRWNLTKSYLKLFEDPSKWDSLVNGLNVMRGKVEHSDYFSPSKTALLRVRQQAPRFTGWISTVAKMYRSESDRAKMLDDIERYKLEKFEISKDFLSEQAELEFAGTIYSKVLETLESMATRPEYEEKLTGIDWSRAAKALTNFVGKEMSQRTSINFFVPPDKSVSIKEQEKSYVTGYLFQMMLHFIYSSRTENVPFHIILSYDPKRRTDSKVAEEMLRVFEGQGVKRNAAAKFLSLIFRRSHVRSSS